MLDCMWGISNNNNKQMTNLKNKLILAIVIDYTCWFAVGFAVAWFIK